MSLPWLHVDGNQVKDEQGKKVVLRGVNIDLTGITDEAKFESNFKVTIEKTVNSMKQYGINALRIAINGLKWTGRLTPMYDKTFIDNVIQLCHDAGIYVLFNCQKFSDGNWLPKLKAEMIRGETTEGTQDQADWLAFWQDVANRYRTQSNVIYSLLNEPQKAGYPITEMGPKLHALYTTCMTNIQAINSKALFVVTVFNNRNKQIEYFDLNPLAIPNVVYAWHDYYPHDLYLKGRYNYLGTIHNEAFRYARYYAEGDLIAARREQELYLYNSALFMLEKGYPILMEECGTTPIWYNKHIDEYLIVPNWNHEMWNRYKIYEKYGVGWLQWIWKRIVQTRTGYGLLEDDGKTLTVVGQLWTNAIRIPPKHINLLKAGIGLGVIYLILSLFRG